MLVIKGGTIVPVVGEKIENGVVVIENGKIKSVGKTAAIPEGAEVIDATGKWVMPGLIDAHTHLSTFNDLMDMHGQYDGNELSSPITPQIRGIDALNPHDNGIRLAREAGFTTCYTGPGSANVVCGTGISFKLKKAATVLEMAIPGSEHMKMALGENPRGFYGWDKKMPTTRMGVAALLRNTLYDAKVYSDALLAAEKDPSKKPKPDFKLDALVPVVRGEMKCRIHCHRADDIVTAVRVAEEFHLDFSIEHCTEGWKILDFLKEHNIMAVVGPLTMPRAKMEIWDRKLELPGMMEEKQIRFCLTEDTNGDTMYLPMHIGLAIARGLSEQAALEAVTIRPARLLGLDQRVGSLEVGKDADIAIFTGFPFTGLSRCEYTIIDGVSYKNF